MNFLAYDAGSQDVNDEFSKLSAHEAKQRLAVLLRRMDTNGNSLISNQELSDWVLNNFRSGCSLLFAACRVCDRFRIFTASQHSLLFRVLH